MRKVILSVMATSMCCAVLAAEPETWILKSYWHDTRVDFFGTATAAGQNAAINAFGYSFVMDEAKVFASQQPGTIPLQLYWSEARQDNATVASAESIAEVTAAGYENKATEGYIYASEQPGTVALKLYYKPEITEYYSTTSATGEQDALAKGFKFVRVEGYVMPK